MLAAGAVRPGLSAPDWMVTASVCLRRSRRPTRGPGQSGGRSRRLATEDHERPAHDAHAGFCAYHGTPGRGMGF